MVNRKQQIEFLENPYSKRRSPNHPVIQVVVKPKIDLIKKYISLEEKNILDVGSGNGYFAYYLSQYTNVVGVDISETLLKLNPISRKIKCDAQDLPFKEGSFDLVISSNLLHHVENPTKVISEMCRVSREYVILSDSNRNNPFLFINSLIRKEERGALKISIEYLKKLLLGHNLHIVFSTTTGFITTQLTPKLFLPFLTKIERFFVSIFGGIYCIIISKKHENKKYF